MKGSVIVDLAADIIPGESIGGISLGAHVTTVVECIGSDFIVDVFYFENFGVKYSCYKINHGAISFACDESGRIVSLWCETAYQGRFNKKLYPGITAKELKVVSKKQAMIKGYLVIDDNPFVYYGMPDNIDDFDDFKQLDDDVFFNELYVGNLFHRID